MNKKTLWAGLCTMLVAANAWAAYPDEVLADGPVAYYRFEETAGTTAADTSGNGNVGTYMNGALLNQASAANLGRAVSFDGSDDYVGTPNTVGGNFSLEMWINTTATSATGSQGYDGTGLLWSDVGGSANDFILAALNDHAAFFTGNPDATIEGTSVLNGGGWHHLVATRAQGGATQLYVDAVLQVSGTSNGNLLTANGQIAVGGNVLDSRYFDGLIDEVAYYPSVLSAARVQAHYAAGGATPSQPVPALGTWALLALAAALAVFGLAWQRRRVH